jgi:hypothetical protein
MSVQEEKPQKAHSILDAKDGTAARVKAGDVVANLLPKPHLIARIPIN